MKASLEGVPGVMRAEVDLARREATADFEPGTVTEAQLLRAIERVDTRLRLRHWMHYLLARIRSRKRPASDGAVGRRESRTERGEKR